MNPTSCVVNSGAIVLLALGSIWQFTSYHPPKPTVAKIATTQPDHIPGAAKMVGQPPTIRESRKVDLDIIMLVESGGDPLAVSPAGARGAFQFMPGTWADVTARLFGDPLDFSRAYDLKLSRQCADEYFVMIDEYLTSHGVPDGVEYRIAAYNGGMGRVNRLFAKRGAAWRGYLPEETQNYLDLYETH